MVWPMINIKLITLPTTGGSKVLARQVASSARSSCGILPLALFGLGVSGAWIGNFTRLAPYQPYFLSATLACLGYGYWLVYRSSKHACADGEACARPLPDRIVKTSLVVATILVV